MAERLSFYTNKTPYNSMLAAEHLSRYEIASKFCKGKHVLDIACGEGYGSAYIADRDAASVVGIDISLSAIENAKKLFSRPNISFRAGDALDIDQWNPERQKFDVIACFETIEHVLSPETFLTNLRESLSPNGTILISCPNDAIDLDHGEKNPFHMRPYTFDDFKALTTQVLGEASQWMLASPTSGISVVDINSSSLKTNKVMLQQIELAEALNGGLLLPVQVGHEVEPSNCSFYLGIWNGSVDALIAAAQMSRQAYLAPWFEMLTTRKNFEDAKLTISKLQKRIKISEQRTTTIRRIAAFEFEERLRQRVSILMAEKNHAVTTQIAELVKLEKYQNELAMQENSRAFRVASLYVRSTKNCSNPISKFLAFSVSLSSSITRSIIRRFRR